MRPEETSSAVTAIKFCGEVLSTRFGRVGLAVRR